MFAIIKTGGKQYKIQPGDVLSVEKIPAEPKQRVLFNQVLLIGDDQETLIGTPYLEKAAVRAQVLENLKDEKIIVFKKKRRKQFRRTRGHRQELTRLLVEKIFPDVSALTEEDLRGPEVAPEPAVPAEAKAPAAGAKPAAPTEKKAARKESKPKAKAAAAAPAKAKTAAPPKEKTAKAPAKKKGA